MEQPEIVLDVRQTVPMFRHPLIFTAFNLLRPGMTLELVNDHDPAPLRYQLVFEHQGEFEWAYAEQGPDVWRVAIRRVALPAS